MQAYGLVGNLVGHSLSSPAYEAAHEETGLDTRCITLKPTRDDIVATVEGMDALGVPGSNVTIPFKQNVFELVDPDPFAEWIGVVSTVDFGGETPKGYNTDAMGVIRSFKCHGVSLAGNSTIIVGAGGVGWVAASTSADVGASIHVANRAVEIAIGLTAAVPGMTDDGPDMLGRIRGTDVLINAASVGMGSLDETPVFAEYLHGDLAVFDAVRTPLETRLLHEMAATDAVTIDGTRIPLLQGVEVFERWTGRNVLVDAINAAFRSHLKSD